MGKGHLQIRYKRDDCSYRDIVIRIAFLLMSICHCSDSSRRNLTSKQIMAIVMMSKDKEQELLFMANIASKLLELNLEFYVLD